MTQRKCDNWLTSFCEWTLPRSEAPDSFIFWTGLYSLAAVVRRHVKIPQEILGSWEVSPHMYVMFVAPPGKSRKSTTANYTEELLHGIPKLTRAPEVVTQASLLQELVGSPDHSIYVTAPEFGEFIMKSGMDMYGFLTNLFDGKRNIKASTIGRGVEFAERPCISLLGATTPEWIAGNMPASVIGGGFASRVIFIYEDTVRERRLIRKGMDFKRFNTLRKDLGEDLTHLALNVSGNFEFDPEAERFIEEWYQKNADVMPADKYKLHGYYERKPAHIMKVAMLLHLAYSDELCLTVKDLQEAIALLDKIEVNMPKVFQGIGRNPYTADMDRIEAFIQERRKVSQKEILRHFYSAAEPEKVLELLNGLCMIGSIKAIAETDGQMIYKSANGVISPKALDQIQSNHQGTTVESDQS